MLLQLIDSSEELVEMKQNQISLFHAKPKIKIQFDMVSDFNVGLAADTGHKQNFTQLPVFRKIRNKV